MRKLSLRQRFVYYIHEEERACPSSASGKHSFKGYPKHRARCQHCDKTRAEVEENNGD